jgi:hypothetical protein
VQRMKGQMYCTVCLAPCNLLCWSQNIYAMYTMRVIPQNSRRKIIVEAQAADYRGYCIYLLKQLKLPPPPGLSNRVKSVAKNVSFRCKENGGWSHTYCIMHWSGH